MNKSQIISIKTTTVCQLRCKNCFVVPWMNKLGIWHWSMKSVENFIEATVKSKYHFRILLLSGGEPLLWENLIPALEAIREAKITDKIKMLTNSIAVNLSNLDWFERVVKLMDLIRISRYVGNDESIRIIKTYFRANPKIHISDKTEFVIQPDKPIKGSLPADCACNYPTIFGDEIFACGGTKFLGIYHKIPINIKLITPIKKGYLDYLETDRVLKAKYIQRVCQYCMVNRKVLNVLKKEKNYCLRGQE